MFARTQSSSRISLPSWSRPGGWWGCSLRDASLDCTRAALSGTSLLFSSGGRPFAATGLGLLLYTTIASCGYFVGRREFPIVAMFAGLVVLTTTAITLILVSLIVGVVALAGFGTSA